MLWNVGRVSFLPMYMFRNVREVLVKDVNTPPPTPLMIIRQHAQHVKDAKKSNPIPPFRKASFLKFAIFPRDRKWHISKLTTLPRAPYQPHAKNYHKSMSNHIDSSTAAQRSPRSPRLPRRRSRRPRPRPRARWTRRRRRPRRLGTSRRLCQRVR